MTKLFSEFLKEAEDDKQLDRIGQSREQFQSQGRALRNRKASALRTRERTSNINLNPQDSERAFNYMSDLERNSHLLDLDQEGNHELDAFNDTDTSGYGDDEGSRERSTALSNSLDLEWHTVKNLPGFMSQAIRAIGRQVFRHFTNTPLEEIQIMASLGGDGPNSVTELNALAGWLKKNGMRDKEMELKAEDIMPGYGADIVVYNTNDTTFMLVKDFAGHYVYAWPGGRGQRLNQRDVRRLPKG